MKKFKRWALLSAAGVLAFLIGSRVEESAVLDHDMVKGPR